MAHKLLCYTQDWHNKNPLFSLYKRHYPIIIVAMKHIGSDYDGIIGLQYAN